MTVPAEICDAFNPCICSTEPSAVGQLWLPLVTEYLSSANWLTGRRITMP
jgi:hypothetical protein